MDSAARINPYRTASFADDPEFLDSHSLHLSGHGTLDDLDFLLDGSSALSGEGDAMVGRDIDGGSRLTAKSACSSDIMDVLLASSKGSAAMDMDFDALEGSLRESLGKMSVDDDSHPAIRGAHSLRSGRSSSIRSRSYRAPSPSSRHSRSGSRFDVKGVNFDPLPVQTQQHSHQQGRQFSRPQLQMSRSDHNIGSHQAQAAMMPPQVSSMAQSISRRASNASNASQQSVPRGVPQVQAPHPQVGGGGGGGNGNGQFNHNNNNNGNSQDSQYNKALQRLAESMKRTEESRSHVMMQRDMLTFEQRQALCAAKQALNKQRIRVNNTPPPQQLQQQQQQQQVSPHVSPHPHRPRITHTQLVTPQGPVSRYNSPHPPQGPSSSYDNSPHPDGEGDKSSLVSQFFSGSRGTLTTGLEQSRKQLSMYMGQVNTQTL